MQKTTTLKDFRVFVLKTILAIFVLSISFKGIGQDLRAKKLGSTPAKPAQIDAMQIAVQKSVAPLTDAQGIALKQQMMAQGADRPNGARTARSNSAVPATPAQRQSDNPNYRPSVSVQKGSGTANPTVACLFSGSLLAGDLTMPQRLFRPGAPGGTCAAARPFPGTISAGLYFYDTYTFVNTTGAAACVTANLTTTDLVNANIQHGAWLGSFNPASMATNYIADPYVSSGTPAAAAGLTFSFNLANGATVVFVVWSANPNTGPTGTASQYTLSVDGLPNLCPQPACVPPTASVISAISIPLTEGFDATPIPPVPAGWATKNNSSPIGATGWFNGNAGVFTSHSGASYIAANFQNGGGLATISNWLMAPTMTLRNGDQLKFWTRTTSGAFPDRLQVRMSQNGASTNVGALATDVGDYTSTLLDINPTYSASGYPLTWTQMTATVSGVPAAGISGRVAFRYFVENGGPVGANSDYIGIDDVQYIASGTPSVCAGSTAYLKVDITGGSAPFTVKIQPTPPGTPASIITVAGYNSGDLIPVTPAVPTSYTIVSVQAAGTGTCFGTNNSGVGQVNISPAPTSSVLSQVQIAGPPTNLINEDFVVVMPPGWSQQNLSSPVGLTNWFQGNAGVFPANSGAPTSYLAANFNNTTGLNTISNWAFPPSVLLKNGDKFSFFTRTTTGTFPDRLQLRMNTTNTGTNVGATNVSVGDFSTLLLDINPTYTATGYPTAWTQFTVTMSGLPGAGVNGRLAFRYFVEGAGPAGANSDYIGIDNAVYTTFPLVNPQTCTGSTANLKVDITGGTGPYIVRIQPNPPNTPASIITVSNYTSGANIPVTPPVTTQYTLLSVQDATGCFGTGNSGTPTITVSPTTIGNLQIIEQPTGPLCAGDPKLLTVTGAPTTTCFANPGVILIPGVGTSGPGAPYPATINVIGLPTSGVTVKSVTLFNMNHTWTSDIDIVLQHPDGLQNVILLSDFGGANDLANTTLTFDDAAAATVTNVNPIPSGTYKCTNVGTPDSWPPPGPANVNQANPTLATFTGDPNGLWKLYTNDQAGGDVGNINGGYNICFNVPSAPPVGYTWLWSPAAGLSSTTTNPVAASPMVTTTYTVMGTAPSGCQTTAAITITVLDRPAVTQHPTSVTACAGTSVSFTGAGSGAGISYQWQVSTNAGVTWTNIPAGAPYSGETTTTLTINPVAFAMNNYRYRLVVSGTCTAPANSNGAILTVLAQPTVTVSPTGTVCGGVAGIIGTKLKGGGAVTYTWSPAAGLFLNSNATGAYVAGSNADSVYAAPTVYTTYTVTGTGANGCTNTATVNVNATPPPPVITPNPVSMCLGDPAVRLVNASNAPGSCVVNSGAINLPIADGAQPGIASTLAVACVPVGATITSIAVTFSVPAHTYIADLTVNLKAPNGVVLNLDKNLGATGNQAGAYPNLGIVNATIASNGVAALSTAATTPLTGTWKADLINGGLTPGYPLGDPTGYPATATSWAQLYSVPNGNWTLAIVDDGAGDIGSLTNWSITINYTPGAPSAAAVWSPNFPGPNNFLWLDQAQTQPYITGTPKDTVYTRPVPAGVYTYDVTVNSLPTPPVTISSPMTGGNTNAIITFNVNNTNSIPYTFKTLASNASASTTVPQVNLWYKITPIAGAPGPISNANGWFIAPGGTASNVPVTAGASNAVLNNINLPIPSGANYGFALEFTGGNGPAYTNGTATVQNLTNNGIIMQISGNVGWGGFAAPASPGNNPRNFNGTIGLVANLPACTSPARVVTVTVNNPITITIQPVNHSVCTNGSTSFTVAATGSNVTYQWQVSTNAGNTWTNIVNNANYSGATTATLTITNPPVAWNGYLYRALVNGAVPCPSVPSNNVVLTVNPLPTITLAAAPYRNLLPGLTTAIFATSSPTAATYQWFRNGTAVPGGTVNPLTVNIDGLGRYTVRITDVNGCTNTSGFIDIADSTSARVWIYPNPTGGVFGVRYNPAHNNVLPRGLNVRDALGKLVWSQKYTLGIPFASMNVNLSNMATGVYWVEVVDVDDNRLAVGRVEILR